MKKYGFFAMALILATACNNNKDKEATPATEAASTSGAKDEGPGLLSGRFEIIDYKKNNVQVVLAKKQVQFNKKGDVLKWDGTSFSYKIIGDTLEFYSAPSTTISKSKIKFLSPDSSSFILINPVEKTEFTYKKVK
ncbi:MAG: hypothetical protein ABUT20_17550 [Bacteroidota bacterium]